MFSLNDLDLELIDHYKDFLPAKVFDAHTHIYHAASIPMFADPESVFFRPFASYKTYSDDMGMMLPGLQKARLLMMPMLDPAMADRTNGFLSLGNHHALSEASNSPGCAAAPYILPDDPEEAIEAYLSYGCVKAFKCYCYGTGKSDCENMYTDEFLSEALWRVANRHQMPVILHIMRPDKLSDPANKAYIDQKLKQFPDAKLILAHCGTAFAEWTILESFQEFAGYDNLWFDFSAICEPAPMLACIRAVGSKHCLWGSDYPNSLYRGKSVSIANSFDWLLGAHYEQIPRTCIGVENITALYHCALLADLNASDIEDIFYNNAVDLFHV